MEIILEHHIRLRTDAVKGRAAKDFDTGVNVIVGYNGSGKSNFFNAILFVISDRFGTLHIFMLINWNL